MWLLFTVENMLEPRKRDSVEHTANSDGPLITSHSSIGSNTSELSVAISSASLRHLESIDVPAERSDQSLQTNTSAHSFSRNSGVFAAPRAVEERRIGKPDEELLNSLSIDSQAVQHEELENEPCVTKTKTDSHLQINRLDGILPGAYRASNNRNPDNLLTDRLNSLNSPIIPDESRKNVSKSPNADYSLIGGTVRVESAEPMRNKNVNDFSPRTAPQQEVKSGVREKEDGELLLGSIVGRKWIIDRRIAAGSFGTLFVGRNVSTRDVVAIKAERRDSAYPQLHRESKFYQILSSAEGIPAVMYFGECSTGNRYHILVMQLLGPNLEDLLQACGGSFSLKTTCMVAVQLLSRMEYIHSKGILYRDIKSENFLLGRREDMRENLLHVVDFGLSKEFLNSTTKQHIKFNVKKGSVGTPRYMSINALQHHEQGRRDDIEALSYLLLYLFLGQLPWQGLPGSTFAEKCKRILEKKLKLTIDEVCVNAPVEFARLMKYARSLEYEEKPDYNFCRQLFLDLLRKNDYEFGDVYDWTDTIPDFWIAKNRLLDNLPELPDDLSARIRAAEEMPVSYHSSRNVQSDARYRSPLMRQSLGDADGTDPETDRSPMQKWAVCCCPCLTKKLRKASRGGGRTQWTR